MVEAEVFHMLVERLGNIEDTLGRINKQLREDRQPRRLADLKVEHFAEKAVAHREQNVIQDMFRRSDRSVGTWLNWGLNQSEIDTLKRNGFSVFANKKYSLLVQQYVSWGGFTLEQFHDEDIYQL